MFVTVCISSYWTSHICIYAYAIRSEQRAECITSEGMKSSNEINIEALTHSAQGGVDYSCVLQTGLNNEKMRCRISKCILKGYKANAHIATGWTRRH